MRRLKHISGFKQVIELMKKAKTKEAVALQRSLQDEFMTLYEENETLKAQLAEVAEVLDLSECMIFDGHKYFIEEEGHRDGPFCQVCYDREGALVRLGEHERHWECLNCNNLYMKPQLKSVKRKQESQPAPQLKEPIPLFAK